MPTVTIGFVPRERFSLAAESLQRIFDCTHIPFNLIVVNCNIPQEYWQSMEKVLSNRSNVKVIRSERYLLPNEAKNLVIQEAKDEFLCLIENDNLVEENWLSKLIKACEEYPADVAVPLIMEGRPGTAKVHFDDGLGFVKHVQTPDGPKLEIRHRKIRKELNVGAERRSEEFMETHCLLFRRNVFDRIGPFDDKINTSEEVDLSLALYHGKVPVVFEPKCVIHYVLPTFPLPLGDRDYFLKKWDLAMAKESHKRIQNRWNLARFPQVLAFVTERYFKGLDSLQLLKQQLTSVIPPDQSFILVDQEEWSGNEIREGLKTIPFLERDGKYWGVPANDETAISELERLRKSGASHIVFVWHTFWWLKQYSELARYLHSNFDCVLENDFFVVFDLRHQSKDISKSSKLALLNR